MQETKIIGSRIPSGLFHYSPTHKEFVAEASDLPSSFDPVSQIWNDSADAGFVMVGQKSDAGMIFVFDKEVRDNEGDITEWTFKAEPLVNKEFGLDYTVTATILND